MTSFLTPSEKTGLVAALVNSQPSGEPLDLAIALIMNRRRCSQGEAFAVLRDLRPAIATISEVPAIRTQLTGPGFPQDRWKWVATEA
jgi:hypothetical protein